MKKIVVIIISILFVVSVLIINFFGMQIAIFDTKIYVDKVECNSVVRSDGKTYQVTVGEDGKKRCYVDFIEGEYTEQNAHNNPNTFSLDYRIYPDNADNRTIVFSREPKTSDAIIFLDAIKSVVFLKPNRGVWVTIKSNDGSNHKETIFIVALKP